VGLSSETIPHRLAAVRRLSILCLPALLITALFALGCGGGDGETTSTAALTKQLIPASQLLPQAHLKKDQEFNWTDPIDFVFDGILVPGSVPNEASKTVDAVDKGGFDAGAGEILTGKGGDPQVHLDVAKFGSDGDAADVRDFLNQLDLQQPCHGPCSVNPKEAPTFGIANAKSVHQFPKKGAKLPPDVGPPFERRVIEFTIGPYLYIVDVAGRPGGVSDATWKQGVDQFYAYAKKKTPSS
jgi:hypothetical protein